VLSDKFCNKYTSEFVRNAVLGDYDHANMLIKAITTCLRIMNCVQHGGADWKEAIHNKEASVVYFMDEEEDWGDPLVLSFV
jgi:hypothetical protein